MKKTSILLVLALLVAGTVAIRVASDDAGGAMFSHDLLERDRAMTEQMSGAYGPEMEVSMEAATMLERSQNEDYLRAPEEHTRLYDKMVGRF